MILRVGHYSQIEFITVRDNSPVTLKGKHGTTRTLANGLFPFGWIRLTPCSETDYLDGIDRCEAFNRQSQMARENLRAQVLEEKNRRLVQIRKKKELARKQAESEQLLQRELAALPEDERLVLLMERGKLSDNEVFELYYRIDTLEPSLKKRAAIALKTRWAEQARWKKKNCSKKQMAKVAKIKKILVEA